MKSQPYSEKPNQPNTAETTDSQIDTASSENSEEDTSKPQSLRNLWRPVIIRYIQGHSMMPVLPPGTLVWARSWFRSVKKGDIIIFMHDGKEKIKRIADTRSDEVYLLGDHEETSTDSRHFGWIGSNQITAKVFWPHAPKERAEDVS